MCMTVEEVDVSAVIANANIKYCKIEAHLGILEFTK